MPSDIAQNRTLMVVEDDPGLQKQLKWLFEGCRTVVAGNRVQALSLLAAEQPQVVTLDLGLPPDADGATEGLKTLEDILAAAPETKVVIVSGNRERDKAVRAVSLGAYDFYEKPIDAAVLPLIVERAFRLAELEAENRRLRSAEEGRLNGVITSSPSMHKVCRSIEKIGPADVSVLLLGESGTGKEVLAKALHAQGPRRKGPFVAINCAAIPEGLLESELFGHERGAFTGAVRQVKGKIELAHKGTLLLDEIGDMPMPLQVKLLRFLQERRIERVGGRDGIAVDVRVIAATHQNVRSLIAEQRFREDLYYRIAEVTIDIPPLRDRDEDAILLARHFIEKVTGQEQRRRKLRLSACAMEALRTHAWPGNVRELESRIKRACILAEEGIITAEDLGLAAPVEVSSEIPPLREARERAERLVLLQALESCGDNLSAAARLLGISRPTLYDLMRQHDLDRSATKAEQGEPADA